MITFNHSTDSCRRGNKTMFYRVLVACDIGDTGVAARYLAATGVPFSVAHRVLLYPNRRRSARA